MPEKGMERYSLVVTKDDITNMLKIIDTSKFLGQDIEYVLDLKLALKNAKPLDVKKEKEPEK